MTTRITLSLISHTNVGKTTLARTLLRRDVGEVRDEAHVTDVSEAHELIRVPDAALTLWDTPGFGDSARLLRRLRREGDPIGWLLHQVWDRFVNRPLWCSQQAIRNIRDDADIVLYLVNASENPDDAGYVKLEFELLTWLGKPVVVLLNQLQPTDAEVDSALRWREFVGEHSELVRDVLPLDAFARCWTQEGILLERLQALLPQHKQTAMTALIRAWHERNEAVFAAACFQLTQYLIRAATDREAVPGTLARVAEAVSPAKRKAMSALSDRLDRRTIELMDSLIQAHGLFGDSASKIEKRLQDVQIVGRLPIDERGGALAGAIVTGALGGLAADALSGGLTLGGGLIAGSILGALGGGALARGYRMIAGDGEPVVRWSAEFLDQLFRQALLRYLAVAHYGRGRGRFQDLEQPAGWQREVDAMLERHERRLHEVWELAESQSTEAGPALDALQTIVETSTRDVLESVVGAPSRAS